MSVICFDGDAVLFSFDGFHLNIWVYAQLK